ncbi:MAG: molybdopterin-dependent oxidoreductase [Xanthomonadales bacterium]|nr:molybdopterin-dependent oxidoreductase [Xanthomonadales bacterium]
MLVATVAHSPALRRQGRFVRRHRSKAVAGVVDVVQISRGVAVVANNTWAAIKGREALQVTWDDSGAEMRSSEAMFAEYATLSTQDGKVALQRGDAKAALGKAAKTIEATYRFPYLAHAALEPLNAVVHKDGERLHIHGGLQMPDAVRTTCARIAGVKPEQVDLHVMKTGGGTVGARWPTATCSSSHRIAKRWRSRLDQAARGRTGADMGGGRYRPLHLHRVARGVSMPTNRFTRLGASIVKASRSPARRSKR